MINRQEQVGMRRVLAGEAAVDGLFSGLGAGLLMTAFLVGVGLFSGDSPASTLARFSAGEVASPWTGLLSHLAVSAIYGLLYGLLTRPLSQLWPKRGTGYLVGTAYGLLLFGLAHFVILPGTGSLLSEIPPLHFAVAHLLYGLLLGRLTVWGPKA